MISVARITELSKGSILFIHGMCHGAWCWNQGFMQAFSMAGYDCYALDLPFHDRPGKNKKVNQASIADYVQAVHQAVNSIEGDVIIVGHSMGGFITQKYLEQYSCRAAVLLASVPYSGILAGALRYLGNHPSAFFNLVAQDIYGPFVKYANELYSTATDQTHIEKWKKLMRSESFKALLNMMFKPVKTANPSKVPILVTGADNDQVITPEEVHKTATFHQTEAVLFNGFGHNLMLDKDNEVVSGRVIEWLNQELS